ncbi:MAG: transmembrane anchor protein [Brevundimonas sp. 12-68-7]|nr:MAG: transmembrane anchor protein [Brevundimonas sp. 12-68-7]
MYNANKPTDAELPSTRKLLKSTGIAVVIAAGLLVTIVMPAEYGVDPTRVGSVFGLTEMGRIKVSLAAEAQAAAQAGMRSDRTVLTLAPDQGAEIKLVMQQGATVRFTWTSSGGRVNYDTHADRPGLSYHGYNKGSAERVQDELTAAFTGSHGWFWRNRTGAPVTITLITEGAYSEVKRVV